MNCKICRNTDCFYNEKLKGSLAPCENCGNYEECLEEDKGCCTDQCKWTRVNE